MEKEDPEAYFPGPARTSKELLAFSWPLSKSRWLLLKALGIKYPASKGAAAIKLEGFHFIDT